MTIQTTSSAMRLIAVLLLTTALLSPAAAQIPHLFGPRMLHLGSAKLGKFGPFGYGHLADARMGHIGKFNYGQIGGLYGNSFVGAANPFGDDDGGSSNTNGVPNLQAPIIAADNGWERANYAETNQNWAVPAPDGGFQLQQPSMMAQPPPPMLGQPDNQPQMWQQPMQDNNDADFRQSFEPAAPPPPVQQPQLGAPYMWNNPPQQQQQQSFEQNNNVFLPAVPIDDGNRLQAAYATDGNGIAAPMMYW